jgi:uncharacterized alpha-E superfamily protein
VGSSIDNVQWEILLRSVSARGGFRMTYGAHAEPRDIARFLILDRRMPRSLAFCAGKIRDNMTYLVNDYGTRPPSFEMMEDMERRYLRFDIDAVFEFGLHEYIQAMLSEFVAIGRQIENDYRFYE